MVRCGIPSMKIPYLVDHHVSGGPVWSPNFLMMCGLRLWWRWQWPCGTRSPSPMQTPCHRQRSTRNRDLVVHILRPPITIHINGHSIARTLGALPQMNNVIHQSAKPPIHAPGTRQKPNSCSNRNKPRHTMTQCRLVCASVRAQGLRPSSLTNAGDRRPLWQNWHCFKDPWDKKSAWPTTSLMPQE